MIVSDSKGDPPSGVDPVDPRKEAFRMRMTSLAMIDLAMIDLAMINLAMIKDRAMVNDPRMIKNLEKNLAKYDEWIQNLHHVRDISGI